MPFLLVQLGLQGFSQFLLLQKPQMSQACASHWLRSCRRHWYRQCLNPRVSPKPINHPVDLTSVSSSFRTYNNPIDVLCLF
uniref:Uncharacterized protein n=1 Tax=Physcomitrium patens TaxID=3218 RepID=A0A2K1JVW1_PHYPA|nr:hypothetical protein PHYPA_015443 [Physcomitrium patens]